MLRFTAAPTDAMLAGGLSCKGSKDRPRESWKLMICNL